LFSLKYFIMTKSEINEHLNTIKETFRNAGIKCTNQRLEIFHEVVQDSNHPDAETVFRNVRKQMPNISLDTVYRTLWLLKDLGLITTLGTPRERTRFDANLSQHHHFICNQCGKTSDLYSKELDEMKISKYVKNIGEARTFQVNIHGLCLDCAGNINPDRRPGPKLDQHHKGESI